MGGGTDIPEHTTQTITQKTTPDTTFTPFLADIAARAGRETERLLDSRTEGGTSGTNRNLSTSVNRSRVRNGKLFFTGADISGFTGDRSRSFSLPLDSSKVRNGRLHFRASDIGAQVTPGTPGTKIEPPPIVFDQDLITDFNPQQLQGIELLSALAESNFGGVDRNFENLLQPAFSAQDQFLDRRISDVGTDPITQRLIEASIDPVRREFLENVLPALGASENAIGQVGGTRGGLIASQLGAQHLRDVGNITANLIAQERNRLSQESFQAQQLRAGFADLLSSRLPQLQSLGPRTLLEIGGLQQEQEQAEVDAKKALFDEKLFRPFDILQRQFNLTSNPVGGSQTQTTGTNPAAFRRGGSKAAGAIGGAVSGAAAGAGIGGLLAGGTAAAGAGIGGLLGGGAAAGAGFAGGAAVGAGSAAGGAAAGAAAGSVVPVIGTIIGGILGLLGATL